MRIFQGQSQNVRLVGDGNKVNVVGHQTIANEFDLGTLRALPQ